jgi:hypothetical protein
VIAPGRFGVFATAFAVAYCGLYILVFVMNWAAFTYHSALGRLAIGPDKPQAGPAMYWYGWIVTSAVGAVIVAAIVAYLPDRLTRRLPVASAWVAPLVAMLTAAGLMVHTYFMR